MARATFLYQGPPQVKSPAFTSVRLRSEAEHVEYGRDSLGWLPWLQLPIMGPHGERRNALSLAALLLLLLRFGCAQAKAAPRLCYQLAS